MTWSTNDLPVECQLARSQLQRGKNTIKGWKEPNGLNGHTVKTEIADGEQSRPVTLDGKKSKEVGTSEFAKDETNTLQCRKTKDKQDPRRGVYGRAKRRAVGVHPRGLRDERDLDRIGTSRCFGEDVGDPTGD
ncbi:hypothetical protein GN958_ATG11074 [Phytophthora infestans]|uniref:Uncharacterized protein n=1 Tax=Phytophthora infestans TaxID=4787 RepID=A0A8S9UKH7_PHYIN|nr:hypothetical protein GN958_ATG11074 [Phytophthora infestans]